MGRWGGEKGEHSTNTKTFQLCIIILQKDEMVHGEPEITGTSVRKQNIIKGKRTKKSVVRSCLREMTNKLHLNNMAT